MINPVFPVAAIAVVSLALVCGGVILAQTLQLAACPLCILQRMLYLSLAFIAGLSLWLARRAFTRRLMALPLVITSATGMFIAGYQVWLQRFAPMTTCGGSETWWESLVRIAGEQVPLLFHASGNCSDQAWIFLGLAIADWSLLAFMSLLSLSLLVVLGRHT